LKIELKAKIYATAFQVIAWSKSKGVSYELSAMHKLLKRLASVQKEPLVPSKLIPSAILFVRWFEWFCARLGPDDRLYFGDAFISSIMLRLLRLE